MAALDKWLRDDLAPASAERLEIADNAFVLDAVGNVSGGVRTPFVDAPIAVLSGLGQTAGGLCSLFGTTRLLDNATLATLYPDHASYVAAVNASTDRAVGDGFLLAPDADVIKAAAEASSIGNP